MAGGVGQEGLRGGLASIRRESRTTLGRGSSQPAALMADAHERASRTMRLGPDRDRTHPLRADPLVHVGLNAPNGRLVGANGEHDGVLYCTERRRTAPNCVVL